MARGTTSVKCAVTCNGLCRHVVHGGGGGGRKLKVGQRRQRPVRLYAEGENRGGKLLLVLGVGAVLLYGLLRLLFGP